MSDSFHKIEEAVFFRVFVDIKIHGGLTTSFGLPGTMPSQEFSSADDSEGMSNSLCERKE